MKRLEHLVRKYELAMLFTMAFAVVMAVTSHDVARVIWFAVAVGLAATGCIGELSMWYARRRGGDNGAEDQETQPRPGPAGQSPGGKPGAR